MECCPRFRHTKTEVVHNLWKSCRGTPVLDGWVKRKRQVSNWSINGSIMYWIIKAMTWNQLDKIRSGCSISGQEHTYINTSFAKESDTSACWSYIIWGPRDWKAWVPLFPGRRLISAGGCIEDVLSSSLLRGLRMAYFLILCVATLTGRKVFFPTSLRASNTSPRSRAFYSTIPCEVIAASAGLCQKFQDPWWSPIFTSS